MGAVLLGALWGAGLAWLLAIAVYDGPARFLVLFPWLGSRVVYGRAAYRPSLTALVIRLAVVSSGFQWASNRVRSFRAL